MFLTAQWPSSYILFVKKSLETWAKTWPGLVIPQRNPLLYNNGDKARRDVRAASFGSLWRSSFRWRNFTVQSWYVVWNHVACPKAWRHTFDCFRRARVSGYGWANHRIQRGEQGRKAARLSVQGWQGCGGYPIRRRCFSWRKTMLLAETRTIINTPQAKQVTWKESDVWLAGFSISR